MAFYVSVGPRGVLFRVGMILTGILGALAYRRAFRRRALRTIPLPIVDRMADAA